MVTKQKFVAEWYDWASQIERLESHLLNSQIHPRNERDYVNTVVRMKLLKSQLYTILNDVAMLDSNLEGK